MRRNRIIKYISAIVIGLFISALDNCAFGGEISPVIVIMLLFLFCAGMAFIVNTYAYLISIIIWIFLPLVHFINHLLGFTDSIQPNTYQSIFLLALVTFAVSQIGFVVGRIIRKTADFCRE
jgi:hypothetical protein